MLQAEFELPFPTWAPRVNMSGSSPSGIFLNKGPKHTKERYDPFWRSGKCKGTTEITFYKFATEPASLELSLANGQRMPALKYGTSKATIYSAFGCMTEHHFHKSLLLSSFLCCKP